ncbi:hypothetical protein [Glutamicibacter sp. JC586]|uniref:hypothetical protein n=1 Tax=Glutamicibacter sp. JC586 TaxID=2590552 RepID=UPI00135B88E2|nr:hypothetical protein [Glutamicibacter sp. JC586]
MDRKQLIDHYLRVFPDAGQSALESKTRSQLIEELLERRELEQRPASSEHETYPLRRPRKLTGSGEISQYAGKPIFWSWEKNVRGTASSLAGAPDSYEMNFTQTLEQDSLILTAVNSSPPLILSLERVESATEGVVEVERLFTFASPISVLEVEQRLGAKLPRRSQYLGESVVGRVLSVIGELMVSPAPIFLEAGDCSARVTNSEEDAILAISILQASFDNELECESCGQADVSNIEAHLVRPSNEWIVLEIQDHVDDVMLVCPDCHEMIHESIVEQAKSSSKPSCPECGELNPRTYIWGMPAGMPDEEEFVVAGCVLPSGPLPDWQCRACGTDYLVQKHDPRMNEPGFEALLRLSTEQLDDFFTRNWQQIANL